MAAEEKELKTNQLTEFLGLVEEWRCKWKVEDRAIYRGHMDFNWILIAKLFRDPGAEQRNKDRDEADKVEEQLLKEHLPMKVAHNLEHTLFHDFSRYLYAYRPDLLSNVPEEITSNSRAMQEWRQLAIAQHYGLPTRFLDFTTNVLVALFFAVDGKASKRTTTTGQSEKQDSAVWCIEVPNRRKIWEVWKSDNTWLSPLGFAEKGSNPPIANFVDTAFVPEHIDGRINAQGSLFMCEARGKKQPWQLHMNLRDKQETHIGLNNRKKKDTRTLRIRIPADFREKLLEQLDLVGINRATLFPDLGSVANYLTWAVYQRRRP